MRTRELIAIAIVAGMIAAILTLPRAHAGDITANAIDAQIPMPESCVHPESPIVSQYCNRIIKPQVEMRLKEQGYSAGSCAHPQDRSDVDFCNQTIKPQATKRMAQTLAGLEQQVRNYAAQQEREAAQEAEARKPHNFLTQAYFAYIYVRVCHGIRKEYLSVWITDGELESSRKAVSEIERIALSKDSMLDIAQLWKAAESNKPDLYYQPECRLHYRNLMLALPKSSEKKDFGN